MLRIIIIVAVIGVVVGYMLAKSRGRGPRDY